MHGDKWDKRFLDAARLLSTWSKDPSTRVGAVIVDSDRRIVSEGYNGFPRGVHDYDDRLLDRGIKYPLIVHAEANAIVSARCDVRHHVLYTNKFPCSECTKLIIQAGLAMVIYERRNDESTKWVEDSKFSRLMLGEAGVRYLGYTAPMETRP